jgi:hypothetical protein
MALTDLVQSKGTGLKRLSAKPKTGKANLTSTEGLFAKAREVGLGREAGQIVNEKPKLSFLQRLGTGLDVLNPAEAILTGKEKGLFEGAKSYVTGFGKGVASAVTGTDYIGKKRHFSDVVEELGVENTILKHGLGFIGDVVLDPSTYFGGAIAKGIGKVVGKGGQAALKGIGKVAPEVEAGLRLTGEGFQEAVGRAFQYGYKSSKGAKEDVLSFLSKQQKDKLDLAASNLSRLGTGTLTPTQRQELALKMIAGKRAEFLAREAGKSTDEIATLARQAAESSDPIVKKTIEEQIARSKQFAEGITENPYETYFPFIKSDKVKKFLNETQGIKVGSEGYKKQFKNLLTNENMELDPAKAFFTREAQIVSDKNTREFLNTFVEQYGKKLDDFPNVDEARKAGFEILKEKGIFGKELGYVSKYDAALLKDSISPEFQTLDMLAKATGFDAVTGLFKRSVTGLFAPFHVRNFVSGQIQNFEVLGIEALNPKNIAIGQKIAYLMDKGDKLPTDLITMGGKTMKFSEMMGPFLKRFSGDTFYNNDFLTALDKGTELKQVTGVFSKEALKTTAKTLGVGQEGTPFKIARAVGQFIEHQQKATAYVTALNQRKTIQEALELATRAGFDYRELTRFESQIMRRLIPFYSFTRKNIELQLRTFGENPQRINQILKFFENVAESGGLTDEERSKLPDYLKNQLALSFGRNALGQPIVSTGFGTAVEHPGGLIGKTPTDTIRQIASSLNPLIKAPLERAFGKDFFQDRPLDEIVDAKQYQILPDMLKQFIQFREVEKQTKDGKKYTAYTADPEKLHILRNLPTSRLFGYLYAIYQPESEVTTGARMANLFTGIKPKPIDLDTIEYFRDRDKMRELEELLIRAGVLKEFKKTFEVDNQK